MTAPRPLALSGVMLFALGFMGMLGPFGTDAYLPALPGMAADLNVAPAHIEITLSAFTLGMALGQLVLGSLSDRFGRRGVLLCGGILVALASVFASVAPNANVLIILCFVMGLTAASGIVNGRAVVADLTAGVGATRPFSILGMTVSIGPIIGPIGGTLLLGLGGWRTIFVGLAVFATVATILIAAFVPESLPRESRHGGGLKTTLRNARLILTNRAYLTNAVVLWCAFGCLFAYISSSSFIVQTNLHLSSGTYASVFAVNGTGIIVTSFLSAQLAKRVAPRAILLVGVVMQVVAIVVLAVILFTNAVSVFTVLPAMFVLATAMGFFFGPATALAMTEVRFASGTALALMGSVQFLVAAVAATCVGLVSSNALVSLAIVAGLSSACVVTAVIFGRFSGRRANTVSAR